MLNKFLSIFVKSKELQQARWQYNHLKMNDNVFNGLLASEKKYDVDASSIIFGNKYGKIRITVFSNPYCNPCAFMHKRLLGLIDSDNCQIQYVFTSFKPEWNDINKYISAATTTTSSCELSCPNGSSIVRTMTDCPDGCGVDKSGLWCSNNGIKATYTCESGTSNS